MLAKPLAVTSAHRYYIHILIVRIPLGKLSCWLSSHNRAKLASRPNVATLNTVCPKKPVINSD